LYRGLEDILEERGVEIDRSTLNRLGHSVVINECRGRNEKETANAGILTDGCI